MPIFKFTVWSATDLGYPDMVSVFGVGSTATIPADPEPSPVVIEDDDPLFQDGSPDNGQAYEMGPTQVLVEDLFIDGVQVGTAGQDAYVAYTMDFTNVTTGQTGTILVMTVGGYRNDNIVGFVTDVVLNPGDTVQSGGGTGPANQSAEIAYADIICFCQGTMIETLQGAKPVESLRLGDLVKTVDHGFQPIRWIGHTFLGAIDLASAPHLRPIQIGQKTRLIEGLTQDIWVSPQHRFRIQSSQAELLFGTASILAAAASLLDDPHVNQDAEATSVDYYHLLFDEHELIYANGAVAESLHLNPRTQHLVQATDLIETDILRADLTCGAVAKPTVLPCMTSTEARVLIAQ